MRFHRIALRTIGPLLAPIAHETAATSTVLIQQIPPLNEISGGICCQYAALFVEISVRYAIFAMRATEASSLQKAMPNEAKGASV